MATLLLSLGACLLLLVIILITIWRRTDWHRIEASDRKYINADGDHIYYDRHIIGSKERAIDLNEGKNN